MKIYQIDDKTAYDQLNSLSTHALLVIQRLEVLVFMVIVGVVSLVVDFIEFMMTSPPELFHCKGGGVACFVPSCSWLPGCGQAYGQYKAESAAPPQPGVLPQTSVSPRPPSPLARQLFDSFQKFPFFLSKLLPVILHLYGSDKKIIKHIRNGVCEIYFILISTQSRSDQYKHDHDKYDQFFCQWGCNFQNYLIFLV